MVDEDDAMPPWWSQLTSFQHAKGEALGTKERDEDVKNFQKEATH